MYFIIYNLPLSKDHLTLSNILYQMRHTALRASSEIQIRNVSVSSLLKEGTVSVSNFVTLVRSMIDEVSDDSANESGTSVSLF